MPGLASRRVDVVVATYGHPELLASCLRSLNAMTFRDYRLIVVDDASPEPALPVVQHYHPGATVLQAASNGGLVRGLNRGISSGRSPLVALLNDDTEVAPEWLGSLVDAADRFPNAGSFASKMLLMEDPPRFHTAGDGFGAWGMPFNRGVWLDDLGQYDLEEQVFGACAGAALYRRSALQTVAIDDRTVFDPDFLMYLEDVDLAWRLQRRGFDCIYVPTAVVRHHLSASGGGRLASYYVSRNIWSVLAYSMPRSLLRLHWKRIIAHHLGRNARHLRSIRSPEARAALRGTLAGAALLLSPYRRRPVPDDGYNGFPISLEQAP
ncbi:MAG: glycosyltransferase family 2 protein [Thermomicrobiales bacterium]